MAKKFDTEEIDGVWYLVTRQPLGSVPAISTDLSAREKQVFIKILENKQNKEIANELHLSVRGVKFHVSNILRKTGYQTRAELIYRERP